MIIRIDRQNDVPKITEPGKLVYSEKSDALFIRTLKEGTKVIGGNNTTIVETDPIFSAWLATPPNVSIFTNDAGYLTSFSETDPVYTASSWYSTTNNATNWNTSFGWGNHASAGYLTSITSGQITTALGFTPVTNARTLTINGTTYDLSADRSWTVSGGISTLNGLTGATQTFATGTTGTDFGISSSGTVHTFNLPTASATNRGLLSSADWTTFNNKGNGTVTSVAALTLGTTGTDLSSTVATGTTTPIITLNVPTASATNRGALSSADWSTFNNKFTLPSLTNGSVLFSNGTTIAQDNANFFWNDTNNRLGIGTASPAYSLDVTGDIRSSGLYRFSGSPTISNASSALNFNADNGFVLNANNAASNLITVSNAGVYGFTSGFTSSYTNPWMSLGLLRENSSQWRGYIGYPIGIHNLAGDISFTQNTGVTYGAVVVPTETVRFKAGGYVGIGQSSPTAVLHLKAGTATASTAPLKFTTGTLNTVAEAGTIEYVSPNFYFTPVSGERITFGMGAATNNTVVGKGAGGSLSSGVQNTFYGVGAGGTNSNTHYNTCFGHLAGNTTYGNTSYNTFIGWQAGASSIQFTGGCTGIGANAFVYGVDGISIGHTAQAGGGTGIISIGAGITANTTAGAGDHNISIGYQSTTSVLTGADNIAIGYKSGNIMTSGAFNILMGYKAGDTITTGSNNVIIGKNIDAQGATTSNQLSIQNAIFGTGNSGTGTTASTGGIGIYTVAPTCALDVTGGIATSRTAVTAPATTDGNIFSGTYTPTLTGITNVTSSTAYVCQYMRVGNVVTVSGKIEVTPTINNAQTTIGISLPIASNFSSSEQCGGSSHTVANTTAGHGAAIYADATNDRAEMDYFETHGASDTFSFSFTYKII